MNNLFLPFALLFLASFSLTTFITPLFIKIIKKLNIIDDPAKRKHPAILHKKPIPRAGSIPFFLGIAIPILLFIPKEPIVIAILFAGFISLVVGVLDDKYDISPYIRFLVNILSALMIVIAGANIPFITNPFGGILFLNEISIEVLGRTIPIVSYLITVLWIVWVMNMLNWSKGVDGQMPGIVTIAAIVIGLLSLRFPMLDQYSMMSAQISFLIAGAALGFLIYNFYPAKIFPGYGATSVYILLAVVSILASAKLATAVLVLGIPMVDGIFTIVRRLLSGKSPFWHDNKHLHHILLKKGYSQRQIALFYWFFSAILGTIALSLSSKGKLFAIIMLVIIVGGAILFLHLTIKEQENENSI